MAWEALGGEDRRLPILQCQCQSQSQNQNQNNKMEVEIEMVTKEQALTARYFHRDGCSRTVGPRGGVKEYVEVWRRNGRTKTWVRRPDNFKVPVKYGLYWYGYVDQYNASNMHAEEDCPLRSGL